MNTPKTQYWRNVANHGRGAEMTKALHDACDEISKLETQVQELREALVQISNKFVRSPERKVFSDPVATMEEIRNIARAILEKTK